MRHHSLFRTLSILSLMTLALAGCGHFGKDADRPSRLTFRLDHIPVAVNNLSRAKSRYSSQFGLSLAQGPARQGLATVISPFADGSSIELVEAKGGSDSLARRHTTLLADREGASYVAIGVNSLDLLKEQFSKTGVRFEETTVSDQGGRTLYRAVIPREGEELGLFIFKEFGTTGDRSQTQHRNSAEGLQEVWIVVDDIDDMERELATAGLLRFENVILQPLRAHARKVVLDSGEILLVKREHLEDSARGHLTGQGPEIIGASIRIQNLDRAANTLKRARGLKYSIARYNDKSCLIIDPPQAHGLLLEFARQPRR